MPIRVAVRVTVKHPAGTEVTSMIELDGMHEVTKSDLLRIAEGLGAQAVLNVDREHQLLTTTD